MAEVSSITKPVSGAPAAPDALSNVIRLADRRGPAPVKVPSPPQLSDLSFVTRKKEGRKRMCGYNHWDIKPTGGYTADCNLGHELALEYLLFLQRAVFSLSWIMEDMPKDKRTGIEVGFLSTVTDAAAVGAGFILKSTGDLRHLLR